MKDLTYTERWRKVNNEYSPAYVVKLIQAGAPLWIIDYEHGCLRTHMDSGASPDALWVWNIVRKEHGLPVLTRTDLRRRMRDVRGWTEEYSLWEEMAMDHYHEHGNFDVPEFVGKKLVNE